MFRYFVIICLYMFACVVSEEILQTDAHLKYKHIQYMCEHRKQICGGKARMRRMTKVGSDADMGNGNAEMGRKVEVGSKRVCAVRMQKRGVEVRTELEYVEYENSCFLFVDNLCTHYGNEYSIAWSGSCEEYLRFRRSAVDVTHARANNDTRKSKETKKQVVQAFSPLYDIDTAFDYHTCPLSCPQVYSPVCIGVNRGQGHYYKFFTFINHCAGDLYYCKNWREFSPPPDEEELVKSSPLSWSYCAANRYIQFARFTELMSSMGHYGWLAGDYRPTHIMEPNERKPGYG